MKETYNLTNPQKTIWFTEEFYKGTSIENIAGTANIADKVDYKKLAKAINIFIERNDSFRLKFINENNVIKQYVDEFKAFSLETVSVNDEKDVKRIEKELAETPLEVLNSFLFKFKLFKYPDGHGGFVVVMHHLISDAWTTGLLVSEIIDIYDALLENEDTSFELAPSYIDYIASENKYLNSEKFEDDKKFWNNLFPTVPEVATIPSLASDKNKISSAAKRKLFTIPSETMELINAFCKENKISAFNFFMGIFSVYLSRVSGLDNFVIGTPILNRSTFKEKHTTGMFISVVPFRVNLNHENSFIDFAKTISRDFFDIFRHQKYPYETLLKDLREKDFSSPNLFNIMLSYQNMRTNKQSTKTNYESKWLFNNNISDDMEIHFFDINDTGNINIAYDFKTCKYSTSDILALHARILNMINQVLDNTSILLKDVEIVTPDEKEEILYKFNNTKMDYPKDKTIVQLFEEQVEKKPDNIAVVFEEQKLTYRELNEKANSLAHYLVANNVKPNEVVAIFLDKSLEIIVSMLGILKANCAFLPLDIDSPEERISFMLSDANVRFICSFNNMANSFNNCSIIDVSLANEKLYSIGKNNLPIFSNDNLMYIIYTSGSTGKPKGVMVTHKNIVRLVTNQNFISFDKNETMVQTGTISFDACIFEIFTPLLHGFKLYILKRDYLLNLNLFDNFLHKNKISILFLTTGLFNKFGEIQPTIFKDLKYLLTGGDVISPKAVTNIMDVVPNIKLINCYGPTENGSYSTCFPISPTSCILHSLPIGKPVANSTAYVVSKDNNLLPVNCVGELWVGGDGVAKGYLNNECLTQEKFAHSPFNDDFIYKTGDLVKWNTDGTLDFLGRMDNQIKIRGFRIELNEINLKILENTYIKNSITIVKTINNEKVICTYFSSTQKVDIGILKSSLRKSLPAYEIPTYFIELDTLPITANGKIDIKKLPEPQNLNIRVEITLPRNDADSKLVEILKLLLNTSSISIDDNFFDLGGDSLSAINLCAQIQNEFNVQLFVKDILEHPTIKDISDIISSNLKSSEKYIIKPVNKSDFYAVSSAQKRMFFASSMAGEASTLYNVPGGVILDGTIDVEKLEKCLNTLINRHEALRTCFILNGDEVVQKIIDKIDFKLELQNDSKFEDLDTIFNDFVKPFDLSIAPLFRAKFISFTNGKSALLIDMHHIISDGSSLNIFINELCKLYNDESLEPLDITYKDFATFENNRLASGELNEAENYWVNQFKDDIPVLNLPTNYPRPAMQSFEGRKIYSTISSEQTKKLNVLAKSLGVTPYMMLLSIYYILLYKYTSQDDIVVGSPVVGRDIAQTYNLIGMFVNTLALKNKIDSSKTFKEFLETVKQNCLNAYKYQTYPFNELVEKLDIKRDTSRSPLFDTLFTYQNNGYEDIKFKNIKSAKYYIPDTNISKFDLSLEIIPSADGLKFSFEYATKLFKEDFINNLSNHYINILNTILENLDIKIADINMLSETETNKILYEFNNTKMDYPKDKTIVQLFEEQVAKTPDNIAVVFEEQKLTYKELNEKANSLAEAISNKFINKNSVIAIITERSLEMIISIIAVLKSGNTYILIDNTFPQDRVKYILENSSTKLLLIDNSYTINFDNNIYLPDLKLEMVQNNLPNFNSTEDTATIIYTSGSTGNPKGVLLSNTGIVNLVYAFKDILKLSESSKQLGFASVSFDMFAVELFASILLGRTLYLLNSEEIKNPILVSNVITRNNIDFLICTPTKMELLLSNESTSSCLKQLKGFQLGGEILTQNLYNSIREHTNASVYNGYGPTEITACCSNKLVTSGEDISIGTPIPNSKIYILDKDLNICPIGVPGELCVAGIGVSKGYLNDSVKTEKSFIHFGLTNERLYKTGDMALYNNNGELEYIGRRDFQVKINGLRIELSEIETKLCSIKEITSAVVIADKAKTYLKAFIVSDEELSIPAIRKKLTEILPTYMIPKYIFQVDNIPITSNGKVDRRALNNYQIALCNDSIDYTAPETELQKTYCEIWEQILQTKVGIDNDLFDLGADSLSAIKFKVEALNHGIDIPYADIFTYKTIRKLSSRKSEDIITTPIEDFDYIKINKLLKKNKTQLNYNLTFCNNNNILLLGSNGFVGMHIINSFIKNDSGTIYCIMRDKGGKGALSRFLDVLHFYFDTSLDSYIGNRIVVLKGDILKENFGLSNRNYEMIINNVSTIINAAANVKHFGDFEKFKAINIDSIKRTIEFCKKYSKRLIHLSTLSVSGNTFLDDTISKNQLLKEKKVYFSEKDLFINQSLDNVYTRSKFEAEKIVLDNICTGLNAIILRLGNITSRFSDGKFQINPESNAFTNRLKTFVTLGIVPESLLSQEIEFTPVDLCANSIIKCLQYKSKSISVLHIYDRNHIKAEKIINILKELDLPVNVVKNTDFLNYVHNNLSNKDIQKKLEGIVNDLSTSNIISYDSNIYIKSDFSVDLLLRCKFKWSKINKEYLIKYILYLKAINFFANDKGD